MFLKTKKASFLLISIVLCSFLAVSCSDDDDDSPVSAVDESTKLSIGAMFDYREEGAVHGESTLAALEIAEEDINAWLEDNGYDQEVEFVTKDTASDARTILDSYDTLTGDGMNVLLCPMTSDELQFVQYIYRENTDVLFISQTSTSTMLSSSDNIIRMLPDDTLQGQTISRKIAGDNKEILFTLVRDDIWGSGLGETVMTAFTSSGGSVDESFYYDSLVPSLEMETVVEELAAAVTAALETNDAADIGIFFACFDEGSDFLAEAAKYEDLAKVAWYSADGIAKNTYLLDNSDAGIFAESVNLTASIFGEPTSSEYEDLQARIAAKTGTAPYSPATLLYDTAWIAVRAALETDMADAATYKAKFIETAEAHEGLFGKAKMNENGDRVNGSFDFWTVTGSDGSYSWEKNATYQVGE